VTIRIAEHIGPSTTITRELARNGTGAVYLATDSRLDRDVAIKARPPLPAQQ